MAEQKPTTVTDEPGAIPAKVEPTKKDETAAKKLYGERHGIDGKALDDRWGAIPDGLREAFRIQVRG